MDRPDSYTLPLLVLLVMSAGMGRSTAGAEVIGGPATKLFTDTGIQQQTQQSPQSEQDDPLRFARSLFRDGFFDLAVDNLRQKLAITDPATRLSAQQAEDARWLLAQALESAGEQTEAADAYMEFTRRHSTAARTASGFLKAGDLYAQAGDPEEAAASYEAFLGLYPTSDRLPEAEAGYVGALLDQGKTAEALGRVRTARQTYAFSPVQPRLQILEARALHESGRDDESLALTGDALKAATTPADRADAAILRIRLLLATGRGPEASQEARDVLTGEIPEGAAAVLHALLGQALVMGGDPQAALPELRIGKEAPRAADRAEADLWLARAHRAVGEPDSALAAYDSAVAALRGEEAAAAGIEASRLALGQGHAEEALTFADHAAPAATEPATRLEAERASAAALRRLGRPAEALDRYRTLADDNAMPALLRARASMGMGRILQEDFKDDARAGGHFRMASVYAGSGPLWAEAVNASARTLAARGEYTLAVSELQPVADRGGSAGEAAGDRITYWRTYRMVDLAAGLDAIQRAVMAMASGAEEGSSDAILEIARANAGALKRFQTAIDAYDRYLSRVPDGDKAARAFLEKGKALEAMAVVAEHEQGAGSGSGLRDRAAAAYQAAVRSGGNSPAAEEAQIASIALDLEGLRDQPVLYYQAMRDRYRAFLEQFTGSRRLNEVTLQIGRANEGLGENGDPSYYEEAVSAYRILVEPGKPESIQRKAQLGLGRSLYHLGRYEEASGPLSAALMSPPEGARLDEILFLAGDAALKSGDETTAVAHFQELEGRFPESSWTARSVESTGDLLATGGRDAAAISSYRRFADTAAPTERGRARFKLADLLHRTGADDQAMTLARQAATDSLITADWRNRALALWGTTAAALGNEGQALEAWKTLWERAPLSESAWGIAPAYGMLLSDSGEVGPAEQVWGEVATRATGDSLKARAEAELVYLAYASLRLEVGAQRQRDFERAWRGRDAILDRYRPLFLAVEAQVRMQREEWKRAGDLFDEIQKKYGESRYVPAALAGLGQIALQDERLDEAAKRFTELLQRFPESTEANGARFQLAQKAYVTADYATAVPLYRQVAASGDRRLAQPAQYNLVRTLERMESWEAAQQEALTYIERYPDAEDLFDMKMILGQLYREGGRLGQARDWFRSLSTSDSEEQARLRYQTAETLFALGEYREAVVQYLEVAYLNEDQFLFAVTARLRAADSYALMGEKDRALGMYRDMIQKYGADSDYGKEARAHMENVQAGRSPRALPPPVPPPAC